MPIFRPRRKGWSRRSLLGGGLAGLLGAAALAAPRSGKAAAVLASHGPAGTPAFLPERRVAVAYALWHRDANWGQGPHKVWGTPELGFYRSDDPAILLKHAGWLVGAGVDFVVTDWSNDLGIDLRQPGPATTTRFIEASTLVMFDTWAALPAAPRIAVMIGNPGAPGAVTDGGLRRKADEVHELIVAHPGRTRLVENYLGKPLLLVYVGTPSHWAHGVPPWTDDRFTVRFMTGFVTEQNTLQGPAGISRYDYWSWEDRHNPTYSIVGGHPECMTVVAAWRGTDSPGRAGGQTYLQQWAYARKVGPRFILAGTFNEWWTSEQKNPEDSKDVEPSKEFGWKYMDVLKQQTALFKAGK